jgi:dTDP-4-dehydrorhamnose reductase
MRIAVIGAYGQLGSDLLPLLGESVTALGHQQIELTNPGSIASALGSQRLTHVINCAAYNLVHVSTDYVFGLSERRSPWHETDAPGPVSTYGASKLAGEYFVRSLCPRHIVVRTCGLYGDKAARGKGNFVETMLRLGRERPELRIVDDQRCTPTSTVDLAQALARLMKTEASGIYHATNSGDCSWFQFASEIFRLANLPVKAIPVKAVEYGAKARRPDYSVLDGSKLADTIGGALPPWETALACYLRNRPAPA